MFRGEPGLTGTGGGSLRVSMVLRWSVKTDGPVKSSAAIVQELPPCLASLSGAAGPGL
jgi:hypothetical protein